MSTFILSSSRWRMVKATSPLLNCFLERVKFYLHYRVMHNICPNICPNICSNICSNIMYLIDHGAGNKHYLMSDFVFLRKINWFFNLNQISKGITKGYLRFTCHTGLLKKWNMSFKQLKVDIFKFKISILDGFNFT